MFIVQTVTKHQIHSSVPWGVETTEIFNFLGIL